MMGPVDDALRAGLAGVVDRTGVWPGTVGSVGWMVDDRLRTLGHPPELRATLVPSVVEAAALVAAAEGKSLTWEAVVRAIAILLSAFPESAP